MSFDEWKFLEIKVEALTLSNVGFMVLLRLPGSHKGLPIFIGAPEAHSIAQALNGGQFPRPLTHDLMKSVLEELGSEVVRVLLTEAQEGTFFARLVFSKDGEEVETDARPSDAIAMSLGSGAPLFVSRAVMLGSGVRREEVEKALHDRQLDKPKNVDPISL